MRIAFYSPRASHLEIELAHGGDPIFLHDLFAALRRRGHEVHVVSRLDIRHVWKGRVGLRRLLSEVVRVRREMQRFRPDAWLVYDASRTYPDLVGWWPRPRRYVLLSAQAWQSKRLPRRWRWLFSFAHRMSLARASAVTALRPASVRGLRSLGVSDRRLWVLPPAVPIWDPVPERTQARRHLGLDADARIVLCISRFTDPEDVKERKTEIVLDLVRVLAALPGDVVLVLVGDGPGRPLIEQEVTSLGAGDRIRLVGARPRDDVIWFLAACDVYAYPDKLDRPYLTMLEAQACGRPVVAMRTPSAETTVDDGRTGLLARDLDEFRQLLEALISDRARGEAMGFAGREYVTRFHSIEARAGQIEALLQGRPDLLDARWHAEQVAPT